LSDALGIGRWRELNRSPSPENGRRFGGDML
jgi:hypothetical protein